VSTEGIAWRDIGHGMAVVEHVEPDFDGPAGLLWRHDCPDDPRGAGNGGDVLPFDPPVPGGWTLRNRDPLTLEGSVLCRACHRHGFIRDGRWIPA
jgi:hypothetical protein